MRTTVATLMAQLDTLESNFEENFERWEAERKALEAQLQAALEEVKEKANRDSKMSAKARLLAGRMLGSTESPDETEESLEDSQTDLSEGDMDGNGRLQQELRRAQEREVLLMEAYEELERNVATEVDAALEAQRRQYADEKARTNVIREELSRERSRGAAAAAALEKAEADLLYAQDRNELYERGHGLTDVVRELEIARRHGEDRGKTVEEQLGRIHTMSDQIDVLAAENATLRNMAGVKADAVIDTSKLRSRDRDEVMQLRSLVSHLESELEEQLDTETRLRHELLYRVKWGGENAVKLGLSESQVIYLDELIEQMKHHRDFGTSPEQRTLAKMESRLETLEKTNRRLKKMLAMPEQEVDALLRALATPVPYPTTSTLHAEGAGGVGGLPWVRLEALLAAMQALEVTLASKMDGVSATNEDATRQLQTAIREVKVALRRRDAHQDVSSPGPGTPAASTATAGTAITSHMTGADALRQLFREKAETVATLQVRGVALLSPSLTRQTRTRTAQTHPFPPPSLVVISHLPPIHLHLTFASPPTPSPHPTCRRS